MPPREYYDAHGRVPCDNCETLGRPQDGVRTAINASDVVVRTFLKPEGWAFTHDGSILCGRCAQDEKPPRKKRAQRLPDSLLAGEAAYGLSSANTELGKLSALPTPARTRRRAKQSEILDAD